MSTKEVYDVSFVEGKLHILRKNFELRTEIKHRCVPSNRNARAVLLTDSQRTLLWVFLPVAIATIFGSNTTFSYCFEEVCARSMTKKLYGTFYSVVRRKIGSLDVIMAGEVDCSASMYFNQPAGDSLLIAIP